MYTVYVCLPHPSCIYSNVDLSSHAFVYLALHAQVYRHDIAVVSNTITLSITTTNGFFYLLCRLFVRLYSSYVCLLFAVSVVCFVCCIRNTSGTNTKQMRNKRYNKRKSNELKNSGAILFWHMRLNSCPGRQRRAHRGRRTRDLSCQLRVAILTATS